MNVKSVSSSFLIDAMTMKNRQSFMWAVIVIALCLINMKSVSFIYLLTFISLTFHFEEKGIHAVHFAPVDRKSSVVGRYLFSISLFAITLLLNVLADFTVPFFYAGYIGSNIYFYLLIFAVFLLLVSTELPFYYWKGYAKVRLFQLPVILAALLLSMKIIGEEKIYRMTVLMNINTVILLILLGILSMVGSALLSIRIYKRRDL